MDGTKQTLLFTVNPYQLSRLKEIFMEWNRLISYFYGEKRNVGVLNREKSLFLLQQKES